MKLPHQFIRAISQSVRSQVSLLAGQSVKKNVCPMFNVISSYEGFKNAVCDFCLSQLADYAASMPPLVRGGGCDVSLASKDDSGLHMLKVCHALPTFILGLDHQNLSNFVLFLKISLQLGSIAYNDYMEWDIHCPSNRYLGPGLILVERAKRRIVFCDWSSFASQHLHMQHLIDECTCNSPEVFARRTVADLQLPQEFEFAIAQSIYEQVYIPW